MGETFGYALALVLTVGVLAIGCGDEPANGADGDDANADQVSIVDPGACPSPEALLESVRAAAGEGE